MTQQDLSPEIFITEKSELEEGNDNQTDILIEIMNFKTNTKPQLFDKKMQKEKTLQSVYELFESREKVYE